MTHRPDGEPTEEGQAATPRWVKAIGLTALALLLVFVALHLTGRGFRHHGSADPSGEPGANHP